MFTRGFNKTIIINRNYVPGELDHFPYFERFNPNKNYQTDSYFQFIKTQTHFDHIQDIDISLYKYDDRDVVVIGKILTYDEKQKLKDWCQCDYHLQTWWDKMWTLIGWSQNTCPCSAGCLDSISPSQSIIEKTRKYYSENHFQFLLLSDSQLK